jgi:putative membrane protein
MRLVKAVPGLVLGATLAFGAFVPMNALAQEPAAGVARLLNKANAMNYEEIQMAKLAKDKAGDNQALTTYAETIQGDHEANEDAVTALSRQKNVKIEGTPASIETKKKDMQNLNGAQFDQAFLNDAVEDHSRALEFFETEKGKFRGDPEVYLYIQETIPGLHAHLEMARNMKAELGQMSRENPENNKSASR